MPSWFQFEKIIDNIVKLGVRRLAVLGSVGLAIVAVVGFGSYVLSRPDMVTLYTGLSPQDVSRIGAALTEAGISFDVSSDGTKVLVPPASTAQARMQLAEKGLPASSTAGYELFDKLGSMGLTSFMQEITRNRALEGELARSIQTLRGVKAARVHIVLSDSDSFRRERKRPSASVVVKLDGPGENSSAKAIRHLVAAAVPEVSPDAVQVVSTDGTVLAAEGDGASELPGKMIELERAVSKELQEKVRKTLTPYLGIDNFEISVAAKVNIDKRQTSETAYDPKSRVERSLRVIKQADNSKNSNSKPAVGADQNIPGEETGQAPGETSQRSNDRREELTNFEINTKSTTTESQGYRVDQLTVAVLVNRKRLVESTGSTVVAGSFDARLKEIESLVRSSAAIDSARGDQITVAAVDFIQSAGAMDPVPSPGIVELLLGQLGSLIRALTIIGVAAILVMFGFRPVTRLLLEQTPGLALEGGALGRSNAAIAALSGSPAPGALPAPVAAAEPEIDLLDELSMSMNKSVNKRLEKIVNLNEDQAAAILKQWLQQARAG